MADRFPLEASQVDPDVVRLRIGACEQCLICTRLSPDENGPRPRFCGVPWFEREKLLESERGKLSGTGLPVDARDPETGRYGLFGAADPATCPLGRWTPAFLKQFEPKEPTEEDTAEAHARTAAGAGRGLKSFAALLKNVPDAEAGDLLAGATANGLPLDVAQKMATERGLALDGDA